MPTAPVSLVFRSPPLEKRTATDRSPLFPQPLSHLRLLHAWGSALTDSAAALLPTLFPHLESLSLAWTDVSRLPTLPRLTSLDMSQCTVASLFEGSSTSPAPLKELTLFGATVNAAADWPSFPHLARLDLAGARARPDFFFCGRHAGSLTSLDLSNTTTEDGGGGLWGLVAVAQGGTALLSLRRLQLVGGKNLDEEELSLRGDVLLSGKLAKLEELAVTGWDAGGRDWARLPAVLPRLTSLDLRAAPEHGKRTCLCRKDCRGGPDIDGAFVSLDRVCKDGWTNGSLGSRVQFHQTKAIPGLAERVRALLCREASSLV